jgi:hypothetical protein
MGTSIPSRDVAEDPWTFVGYDYELGEPVPLTDDPRRRLTA